MSAERRLGAGPFCLLLLLCFKISVYAQCSNDGSPISIYSKETNTNLYPGCTCPPGFAGTSCQPVKCQKALTGSFSTDFPQQSFQIALIWSSKASFNSYFPDGYESQICDTLTSSNAGTHILSLPSSISAGDSSPSCSQAIDRMANQNSTTLSAEVVSDIIANAMTNSEVVFFSDLKPMSANDYSNSFVQIAIRQAISRRIKVHFVLLPMNDGFVTYDEEPEYQALRTIAEATLGNFITPYYKGGNKEYANISATEAIGEIANLYNENFNVVKQGRNNGDIIDLPQLGPYKIAYRTRSANWNELPFICYGGDCNYQPVNNAQSAGAWKLLDLKVTGPTRLKMTQDIPVNFYFQSNLNAFAAVINDVRTDASTPYGVVGAQLPLVARAEDDYGNALSDVTAEYEGKIITPTYRRDNCQFNVGVGTLDCVNEGPVSITIYSTTDAQSAVVPFYCADRDLLPEHQPQPDSSTTVASSDWTTMTLPGLTTVTPAGTCPTEGNVTASEEVQGTNRQFSIMSRNYKDTLHSLYVANYSLTEALNRFNNQTGNEHYFAYYSYSLFDDTTNDAIAGATTVDNYNSVISSATPTDTDATDLRITDILKRAVNSNTFLQYRYSDILVIIDFKITDAVIEDPDLMLKLFQNNIRLYFVLVRNDKDDFTETYSTFADAARGTGGAVLILDDLASISTPDTGLYDFYLNNMVGGDVVTQSFSKDTYVLNQSLRPSYFKTGTTYTMLINSQAYPPNIVLYGGTITNSNQTIGTTQLITFTVDDNTKALSLSLKFNPPISDLVDVVVLDRSRNYSINVRLSDAENLEFNDKITLSFGAGNTYYPVIGGNSTTSIVTYLDYQFQIVKTGAADPRSCDAEYYKQIFTYSLTCSPPNSVYYLQTDSIVEGGTITRTQAMFCSGSKDGCASGHRDSDSGLCICFAGYSGEFCEIPICQNGGNLTSSNVCTCTNSSIFSGSACEKYDGTCNEPPQQPDYRANFESLIILVDNDYTDKCKGIDLSTMPDGTHYVVVQYTGAAYQMFLSSTDRTRVGDALSKTSDKIKDWQGGPMEALKFALKSQLTGRGLLIWINSGSATYIDSDIIDIANILSTQRTDIRVLTDGDPNKEMKFLAQLGNGVPLKINDATKMSAFFAEYITEVFVNDRTTNVLTSNLEGKTRVIIPYVNEDIYSLYIFSSSSNVQIYYGPCDQSKSSPVVSTTVAGLSIVDGQTEMLCVVFDSNAPYSIEKQSNWANAYGFSANNNDGVRNYGLLNGKLYASISSSLNVDNTDPHPTFQLFGLLQNGDISDYDLYPSTLRTHYSCTNQYYAEISVDKQYIAYVARINVTNSGIQQQQQVVVPIFKANDESACLSTTNFDRSNPSCVCSGSQMNQDCSQPICSVFSSSTGIGVCQCQAGAYGASCQSYDGPPPTTPANQQTMKRTIVFLVDNISPDDTLKNATLNGYIKAMSEYDLSRIQILIAANTFDYYTIFKQYSNLNEFSRDLVYCNNRTMLSTAYVNLTGVFNYVISQLKKTPAAANSDLNMIYLSTQVGGNVTDGSLNTLKDAYKFTMVTIQMHRQGSELNSDVNGLLLAMASPGDAYDAVSADDVARIITKSSGVPDYTPAPTDPPMPSPNSVYDMPTNMYLHVDLAYNNKYGKDMAQYLSLMTGDFYLSPGIGSSGQTFCDERSTDGQSLINGMMAYGSSVNPVKSFSSFCTPATQLFIDNIATLVPNSPDATSLNDRYIGKLNIYLDPSCKSCNRINSTGVQHFMLWLATSNLTISTTDGTLKGLNDGSSYIHAVVDVALGQSNILSNPVYQTVLGWNKNPDNIEDYIIPFNSSDIAGTVQATWTKLLEWANINPPGAYVAPPSEEKVRRARERYSNPSNYFYVNNYFVGY